MFNIKKNTSALLSSLALLFLSFLGIGDFEIALRSSSMGLSVPLVVFGVDRFTGAFPFVVSPFSAGESGRDFCD